MSARIVLKPILVALRYIVVYPLALFFLVALRWTWRRRSIGAPPAEGRLLVFWHDELLALTAAPAALLRGRSGDGPVGVLVSRSSDGDLAAWLARRLGLEVIRGSSSRGAVAAAMGLLRRLRSGGRGALAADGPRGPRHEVGTDVVALARAGETEVSLVRARPSSAWRLCSWDRLAIPKPFAEVTVTWSPVEPGEDLAAQLEACGGPSEAERAATHKVASKALVALLACALACSCDAGRRRAIEELKSADAPVRARALHLLGKRRDPKLAPHIAKLLRDPSPRVRQAAIAALGVGGLGSQLRALVESLHDGDLEVRLAAVRVLGDSNKPAAARALLPLARDPALVVRQAASRALTALGVPPLEQAKRLAAARLAHERRRFLAGRDEQLRAAAARALGAAGKPEGLVSLEARLGDPSPLVLRAMGKAIGLIGGAPALTLLGRLARDRRSAAREAAAVGLGAYRGAGVWLILGKLAADPQPEVVRAAVVAAGEQKGPVPDPLSALLCRQLRAQAAPTLQLAAAKTLATQGLQKRCAVPHGKALAACRAKSAGWQRGLRRRAALLATLAPSAPELSELARCAYEAHREEARRWVSREQWESFDGKRRRPTLGRRPPKAKDRRKALAWLLARYPERREARDLPDPLLPPLAPSSLVSALLELLPDAPESRALLAEVAAVARRDLRLAALRRIGELPTARSQGGAKPPSSASLPASAPALGPPPEAPVARVVWLGLASKDEGIRRAAALGCAHLGPRRGGRRGLALLAAKDFELRSAGARCLGALRVNAAVPALITALGKESQLGTIRALARIGDHRATKVLLRLLKEDHPATRQGERLEVLDGLARLGDSRAAPALERELAHPAWQVRRAAALALARAGRKRSRAALQVCAADYYAAVRVACRRALDAR